MKVLFVTNMFPIKQFKYFGIHVKEQIEALKNIKNIDYDIFFINGYENKLNYFKSIFSIRKILKRNKYDIIHIHYGISGLFLFFFRPKIPVIITLHSGELYQKRNFLNHFIQKILTLSIINKVTKIIVLNDDMLKLLDKHRLKLEIVPCGVDTDFFRPLNQKRNDSKILIGFPGNKNRPEKNYKLFSSIIQKLNDYNIHIVEFHNMTRSEVLDNLENIDVLLMTSLVEGSPQIIKEAMALNKPIVSSNAGDVPVLLRGVKNCYVIDNWEPQPYVDAIKMIIELQNSIYECNGRDQLHKLGLDSRTISERLYNIYISQLLK